jgi:hypothetical protein
LHDEERNDQQQLEQDELHPELRARRCRRRDAARFRIGEGDDQSGTGNGKIAPESSAAGLRG